MPRDRYEISPTARDRKWLGPWSLSRNGKLLTYEPTQGSAIEYGVLLARLRFRTAKRGAEVVIKGPNGRIRANRTFGLIPKRTRKTQR